MTALILPGIYGHPLLRRPGAVLYDLRDNNRNYINKNAGNIRPGASGYGLGLGLRSAPTANDSTFVSPILLPRRCSNALTVIAIGTIGTLATEEHFCSWHNDGLATTTQGPFNFGCVDASKKLRLEIRHTGASYANAKGTTTITAGRPYVFAGTYDRANIRVYLDGVQNGVTAFSTAMQTGTQDFELLRHNRINNAAYYCSGSVAAVLYIPEYAATAAEIKDFSLRFREAFQPTPKVLYFDVGGGTGDTPSAADAGTLTLTGSAANGVRALAGVAASGSIALTGSAANAVRALAGVAASGFITLTGSNAAALRTWLGVAGAGSITITGSDAVGVKAGSGAYTSAADAGSITLSGSAAIGTYDRLAAAGSGSITLTGSDASGIRNIPATAEAGSIALTGSAAVGIRTWLAAAAEAGSITLTGSDAEGVFGGAMTLTQADLDAIAAAVWADPRALTLQKFMALK